MMNADRITKMYEGLTNKERAALCFRYAADGDELEWKRIGAAVPQKSYVGIDQEFRSCVINFYSMANLWAIEHWKLHTSHAAAVCGYLYHTGRDEFEAAWPWDQAFKYCETKLLALDCALESVCKKHGIDVDCIHKLMETPPFVPFRKDTTPNPEYQIEAEANLSAFLQTS